MTTTMKRVWAAQSAARQAVAQLDAATTWMRGDKAALMRQVGEQDDAYLWWRGQHQDTAVPSDLLVRWFNAFYGINISAKTARKAARRRATMSLAAAATHELLRQRAARLRTSRVIITDPQVTTLILTIAGSGVYQYTGPEAAGIPWAGGHVVFAFPIPVRRQRAAWLARSQAQHGRAEPFTTEPSVESIAAVAWHREGDETVRVNDWVRTELGDNTVMPGVGDARTALDGDGPFDKVPDMLWSSEWATTVAAEPTHDPVLEARRRLMHAQHAVHSGAAQRWTGEQPWDDDGTVLPMVAMAVWDVVTAGLVEVDEVTAPAPGAEPGERALSETVTLLRAPVGV